MRHRKAGVKLNRTGSHRNAMFSNMVTSLFKHNRIKTTHVKAMELRRWADQMITLAKRGDLHARRQVLAIIKEKKVVHQLFSGAKDRFDLRAGGYTRVIKAGFRKGDAAPMSFIEFVDSPSEKKEGTEKKKKDGAIKAASSEPKSADDKVEKSVSSGEKEASDDDK